MVLAVKQRKGVDKITKNQRKWVQVMVMLLVANGS